MSANHWCLAYAEESGLRAAVAGFLSEGLLGGQQVGYVGWGGDDELRGRLEGIGDVEELTRRGAARVTSFAERFRRGEAPEPAKLLSFWSDATDAALAAGFTALRAVADTTPWAGLGHEQRARFLRGEQLVDRYRLDHPLTLLCAVDTSTLTGDALAETACVHPFAEGVFTPFHLHATEDADFALHGEIDAYDVALLERVLDSVPPGEGDGEVVVDAAGLDFIGHRSLFALERHAERSGRRAVVLRNASGAVVRLSELLDLRRLRVETTR